MTQVTEVITLTSKITHNISAVSVALVEMAEIIATMVAFTSTLP